MNTDSVERHRQKRALAWIAAIVLVIAAAVFGAIMLGSRGERSAEEVRTPEPETPASPLSSGY